METDIRPVVCAIDFSESSRDALMWAVNQGTLLKAPLSILFPYRLIDSLNGEAMEFKKRIEENAKARFSTLESEILKGSGVPYEFKVEIGFVSNRVEDIMKKRGVRCLVMGNTMSTTSKESFDELAKRLEVPLVIVP